MLNISLRRLSRQVKYWDVWLTIGIVIVGLRPLESVLAALSLGLEASACGSNAMGGYGSRKITGRQKLSEMIHIVHLLNRQV
jgi:hypothetical protein